MEAYLRPEDDGLPMRPSGSWVAEKLDYLRRYVDMFTTSMRSKSGTHSATSICLLVLANAW